LGSLSEKPCAFIECRTGVRLARLAPSLNAER
jgi:hypothetical protein